MKKIQSCIAGSALSYLLLPFLAFAQQFDELESYGGGIIDFINTVLVPLVFAIALAFFIYGVFVFLIQKGSDSSERDKGKMYMLWAIIALVVMVSLWGVVNLLAGGLGFGDTESQTIDTLIQQAPVD